MNEFILQQSEALKPYLKRLQKRALLVGLLGTAASIAGFLLTAPEQFFRSYLLAFIYWLGLSLGSLAILMIHHLGGGRWGFAIRRLLEAGTRTLPLMIVLFVPILFGTHELYEWTHEEVVAHDEILSQKSGFLNLPFFMARSVVYFAIWSLFVFLLNKWSRQQDHTTETYPTYRLQALSGPGLVVFALIGTLASLDWLMSIEPRWYSTIYGLIYMIGQCLLAWAFMTLVAVALSRRKPLDVLLVNERLRDLGTFMLAFVMLWAYLAFSQLIIIWSGNLPEEITWYMTRLEGGWQYIGFALIAFHFALPFLLLISSRIKARIPILCAVAAWLLVMRLVDLFWITAPAFHRQEGSFFHSAGFAVHWLDIVLPIGIGGLWIALFFWQLQRRSLVALNDPRFNFEELAEETEHGH